jgi:hypothetical protein
MPTELDFLTNTNAPLSLTFLLVNLVIGMALSVVLRWHFTRFGSTLSNREEFAQVLPFLLLTTILIITVVKSSLALSLGLVGALSIVRFRTPIKEPEELAYLFIAIAMGLGLGANQTIPTIVGSFGILTFTAFQKWTRREVNNKNLYLSIDWQGKGDGNQDDSLQRLHEVISKHARNSELRRFDTREGSLEATYFLDIADVEDLSALTQEINNIFPKAGITFLDQNQLPSV